MNYFAHMIYEKDGSRRCQTLREHNRRTGAYAASCLHTIGLESCGMLAGFLHDGKGTEKFQAYLESCAAWDAFEQGIRPEPAGDKPVRGGVNHTFAGVIYLLDHFHRTNEEMTSCTYSQKKEQLLANYTSELIACAIGSHHGLFDCQSLDGRNGFNHRVAETDRGEIQYEQAGKAFETEVSSKEEIDQLFRKACAEVQGLFQRICSAECCQGDSWEEHLSMGAALAERVLTSALIYADRRDTAEFADQKDYADREADWKRDIADFEARYKELSESAISGTSRMNQVRKNISDQCRDCAGFEPGIYRLNVPTGGGKTLSSLRFALYHAERRHKKRIFYVAPLLTILEQNARDIREFLPRETVLEFHSDVAAETRSREELEQYDLLKDRFAAPVIITTLVQVLEIFFSGKTASVSRLRTLSDAVMIFDEVQSVPIKMLSLFNAAINFIARLCGTTVILCSATQPEFERLGKWPLMLQKKRMVTLSAEQMQVFDRHVYHDWSSQPMSIEELAEKSCGLVMQYNPLMIVCNTKSEAGKLYALLQKKGIPNLRLKHLSAGMCKAHRKQVIDEISQILRSIQKEEDQDPFILVTTQLVEAGVNLSFRSVVRVIAGDDNLVQSAGRCNRSGEYGAGDIFLVRLSGEEKSLEMLPEIRHAQQAMLETIHFDRDESKTFDPVRDEFIARYYQSLFLEAENDGGTEFRFTYRNNRTLYTIAALLSSNLSPSAGNDKYFLNQPFKTIGENFSVFEGGTYNVIVPYQDGRRLIETIQHMDRCGMQIPVAILREARNYVIQIYQWQKEKLEAAGMLASAAGGRIYILSEKAYGGAGVRMEAAWDTGDFIF